MSEDYVVSDVVIVGAGLAGLMAARKLEEQGVQVCVLDKEERVGGRMATVAIGPGFADHGAQFFTVHEPEFQTWVDRWLADDLIYVWSEGFSDGSLQAFSTETSGLARYAVRNGAVALSEHLASDLKNLQVDTMVVTATCDDQGWIIQDDEGNLFLGKSLLMTAPVPLSLQILEEGASTLTEADLAVLNRIEYAPCLTGIFWVDGRVTLPQPGAVQRRHSNITWIADNQRKGISPDATVVTVQASGRYSAQMWSAPEGRILNALRTDLQIFMRESARIKEAQLYRWPHAMPTVMHDERCHMADNEPLLVFAGDAFGGGRVENAVLSGLAAADAILEKM